MDNKSILIGTPFNAPIDPEVKNCIFALMLYLNSKGFKVNSIDSEGTYLSSQRNALSWQAYKENWDFLLLIDSDMIFKPQEIDYLLEANKDIIGGLYFARREPHFPVVMRLLSEEELELKAKSEEYSNIALDREYFFKMYLNEIPDKPFSDPVGLGVGTGFMLISKGVLRTMWYRENVNKLGKPFNYIAISNGDELKEDLAFAIRMKKLGFNVFCDPRVNLTHIGKSKITKQTHIDFEYRNQLYGNDIPGWMSFNELNWLYHTVKQKDIRDIVEIGSWKGRSTHALLSATNNTVYAVDHFRGSLGELESTHKEATEKNIYNEFMKNVGKFSNLVVVKDNSLNAVKLFSNSQVDMIFIDGDHSYEAVKNDILAWDSKCTKLICGHDFNFSSVNRAVTEIYGDNIKSYESIWFHWKG